MDTPLYNTDIIPMTSRPTLTVMDDGDYFVILDTSTGKISKILKTNIMTALKITYDNTSGLTAENVQAALDELVVNLGSLDSAISALSGRLDTLEGVVDTNRLYSDSQYLALKAKADSLQVKCNTLQAEVYTDDPILQYGAVEIIGDGYEADDTPIDVSANVVDGSLELEQKGLTITNLVNGASIANLGSVTFTTVLNDKYYDTLNNAMLTGTGSDMTATNNSGATANMAIYHLNSHGLSTITDTDILADILPYVDGTKSVGKMGVRVIGRNLCPPITWRQGDWNSLAATIRVSTDDRKILLRKGLTYAFSDNKTGYQVSFALLANPTDTALFGAITFSATPYTPTQDLWAVPVVKNTAETAFTPSELDGFIVQIEMGTTPTAIEPYQEQLTFLPFIGKSLPNGTADSLKTVADGWEHTKRVSTPVFVASGVAVNTTNYPTAKDGGQWVNELTAGGTEIGIVGTDSTTGAGILRFELDTPVATHYDLPLPISGKTIHRFAGEEKISLYGTGVTFTENVLSVLSAVKFVAGEMTDITDLATIIGATVTFSGVNATDVVYVKVEHSVNRPLGILEHTPAVSNTASRLAAIEAWIAAQGA